MLYVVAHDLRRTVEQLAREGGSAIVQTQVVLGHDSVKTIQDYLGIK